MYTYGVGYVKRAQLLTYIGFSLELDEGTTSRQFCVSCTGFLSETCRLQACMFRLLVVVQPGTSALG